MTMDRPDGGGDVRAAAQTSADQGAHRGNEVPLADR